MGSLLTHGLAGVLFGVLAAALMGERAWNWQRAGAVFVLGAAALTADLDLFVGVHRQTLHNVWALALAPVGLGAFILVDWIGHSRWASVLLALPAACVSHIWLDIFAQGLCGPTPIFYPLDARAYWRFDPKGTVYVSSPAMSMNPNMPMGVPVLDPGTLLIALLAYGALATAIVVWMARTASRRRRVAALAIHAALNAAPFLFLLATGALQPLGT